MIDMASRTKQRRTLGLALTISLAACSGPEAQSADLVLTGGSLYSFAWDAPGPDGTPAPAAPFSVTEGWRPDATAIAMRDNEILFVGDDAGAEAFVGASTRVVDLDGETILPGLVDSHTHVAELGRNLERIDLVGVDSEEEAIRLVTDRAASTPEGEWILAAGWDEGAWADRYPTWDALNSAVPNHPVWLRGLHGFAGWGNRLAFEASGITNATSAPTGGEVGRDASGALNGLLLNRAVTLIDDAIPEPGEAAAERALLAGLNAMAQSGYVAVHEAGTPPGTMSTLERLDASGSLPIRVNAMISGRDPAQIAEWVARGPLSRAGEQDPRLFVRAVKAYYDGSLGVRGARLIEDYSDRPGHRGVSGAGYGFNQDSVAQLMAVGFQAAIHAIGDAGNRETLDFIESVIKSMPATRELRNRVEHAQVVHHDDFGRFVSLGLIASMEPQHAAEDMPWAEERIGAERIRGAYAWRTMLELGVPLTFNSDNPGSSHDPFYGLHSAVTRRDPSAEPRGGWYPEQAVTPEEAIRAYTSGAAYAAFLEEETGVLTPGRWADVTVLSIDPLRVATGDTPEDLFDGRVVMTIVGGVIAYEAPNTVNR